MHLRDTTPRLITLKHSPHQGPWFLTLVQRLSAQPAQSHDLPAGLIAPYDVPLRLLNSARLCCACGPQTYTYIQVVQFVFRIMQMQTCGDLSCLTCGTACGGPALVISANYWKRGCAWRLGERLRAFLCEACASWWGRYERFDR